MEAKLEAFAGKPVDYYSQKMLSLAGTGIRFNSSVIKLLLP